MHMNTYNNSKAKPPVAFSKAKAAAKKAAGLKTTAVRVSSSDEDKMFAVYFANKNSMAQYTAAGVNYIQNLIRCLKAYSSGLTGTASKPKAALDTAMANQITDVLGNKLVTSLGDATIIVDSQAKRVYYTFGPIDYHINVPFNEIKARSDIMRLLFKSFTFSNMATKNTTQYGSTNAPVSFTAETRGFYPVTSWEKERFPGVLQGDVSDAIKPSGKEYPKEIAELPEIQVELVEALAIDLYGEAKTVNLEADNRTITLQFKITPRLAFPLRYAFWSTYTKTTNTFSIPNFFTLVSTHIIGAAGKRSADQSVKRLIPMQTSMDMLQQRVTRLKLTQEPRINRNRFTILSDGEVLYIPPDGDLKAYDKLVRESYDPETKKVTPLNKIPEAKDLFLLADWIHNVAVYTNTSGVVNTINLIGAMAFEDRFVMRYFHQDNFEHAFDLDVKVFVSVAQEIFYKLNLNLDAVAKQAVGQIPLVNPNGNAPDADEGIGHLYFDIMCARVLFFAQDRGVKYQDVFDTGSDAFKETFTYAEQRMIAVFAVACELILKGMFKVKTKYAINTLMKFALPFYIFGIAGQRVLKYKVIYQNQKELNTKDPTTVLGNMETTIRLPNLPKLQSGLLPHQADAYLSTIHKAPKLVSLDVSAGGTKTALLIMDIVNLLHQGKIKRPLILAPAKLVSEWVSEINKWSQGKLNPYPLTTNSVMKLNKYLGYDRHKLLDTIRSAPSNTIFVSSFSFLKVADPFKDETSSTMQYGGTVVNFYPNTQFIQQGGFDFVGMDESHRLKNMNTQISKAVRSVIGNMEYRRIASGTIIFNTVDDLEGQTALLNPGILSDMRMLIANNSTADSNGKVDTIDPKMGETLAEQMSPYVSRLVYRRRDWAFLLPRINFAFLQCDMSPNLREYYNQKVDKEIEELLKNKKIRDILESEDQAKIDKLMGSLDSSFQKMEILLNSPETDDIFSNLPTTTASDLVPPKSRIVNQIIAAHFNGGSVTDVTGETATFKATKAKIIVFGFNKAVSLGIYKYLPANFKTMAVHYSAGNKDAMLKFRDDPNIKILVGDETSIREGYNLTMASHIIRLQALWTPGAQEQAMSRILRADTENKYGREELYITQIMCRYSLDLAKCARNISKQVSNLSASEGERPDWKQFVKNTYIPDLPKIKMNLKLIKSYGNIESVGHYFSAYSKIQEWDFKESLDITRRLRTAVQTKLGLPEFDENGKPSVDINMIRRHVLTSFESNNDLNGSKAIWSPLVPNATILDKFQLDLQPLAIAKPGTDTEEDDEKDGDDDVDIETNVEYAIGDMVVTEFGFGFIRSMRMGRNGSFNEGKVTSVNIEIPGFDKYYKGKDYVNLSLLEVFKPTNDERAARIEKRLLKLAERNQGILFVKDGISGINVDEILSKTSPVNIKPPPKTPQVLPPKIKPPVHPAAIPGQGGADEDEFDINDLIPAERTGKKTTKVPTPDNTRDVKLPKPQKPDITPTTRKIPDEDVQPKNKPNNIGGVPVPPQLDLKNRNKILTEFQKDPNKLFHYQKQTNTTSVVIDLAIINGEISMATYPGEENYSKLISASPNVWAKQGPMVFLKVDTYKGAQNLAAKMENEFVLLADFGKRLLRLAKGMQSKSRPQLQQNQKMDFSSLKNFVLLNHTAPGTEDGLKAYPTVFDGALYVIIPYMTQRKTANKVLAWGKIPGCEKAKLNRLTTAYSFYRNRNQALRGLDEIAKTLHIVNYQEVRDNLKTDHDFVNFVGR